MTTARKSRIKRRPRSTSSMDKVMTAVMRAGNSLSSMVKDNVKAAETFIMGEGHKAKPTRKRKAVTA